MNSEEDLSNFDKAMKKRGFEVIDPKEPKNYFKKAHKSLGRYKTPKIVSDKINEFDIVIDNTEY